MSTATLRCPTHPDHKQFVTEVNVLQKWVIAPDGLFLAVVETNEHIYGALIEWEDIGACRCNICGVLAVIDLPEGGVAWPG